MYVDSQNPSKGHYYDHVLADELWLPIPFQAATEVQQCPFQISLGFL